MKLEMLNTSIRYFNYFQSDIEYQVIKILKFNIELSSKIITKESVRLLHTNIF